MLSRRTLKGFFPELSRWSFETSFCSKSGFFQAVFMGKGFFLHLNVRIFYFTVFNRGLICYYIMTTT